MALTDAVSAAGLFPSFTASRDAKKRYAELLSKHLSFEIAEGLRHTGFPSVRPQRGGPGERAFQGGLGPKKVDVTYSDEQHGLLLAVSIKSICAPPYGKNLKNRFADLCTEAITLHMRFPYSVVACLFAFPAAADADITPGRTLSTFRRALNLLATVSGRNEYTDPGEKFEHVVAALFEPATESTPAGTVRLFDAMTETEMPEMEYFARVRQIFTRRNPHFEIEEALD